MNFLNEHSNSNKNRLLVLASGHGSNLQAILDSCTQGKVNAEVVGLVSDKPQAYALERARQAGIPTLLLEKRKEQSRSDYDDELAYKAAIFKPDWLILAGWMRILSSTFLDRFPQRVINLHPALPGTFPGVQAIERAFEAYQRGLITHTGIMVHLVPDEGVDDGPLLAQQIVAIQPEDTLESLKTRIHRAEHQLLIQVLQQITATQE
jgi:formyltetrahydrofolate-dependent phosphoribosylglycinamide formyltransferase